MAEYIEREEIMNRLFTEYATDSKADVFELIRSIPAADVQPDTVIKELQKQIASVRSNVKSIRGFRDSDYLTGYIAALSAVEDMIADATKG